jgi:hypothetical protein
MGAVGKGCAYFSIIIWYICVMKVSNCFLCGGEFRRTELTALVSHANNYKVCKRCLTAADPTNDYLEVRDIISNYVKFAQQINDPELASPQITVEPADTLIQKAVDLLKKSNPSYFVGVRKIVLDSGSAYGFVESGKDKDPSVIHLNLQKIKSEIAFKLSNLPKDQQEQEVVRQIAMTIAHEKGHINSYKPETGFVGGEQPAEAEANRVAPNLK